MRLIKALNLIAALLLLGACAQWTDRSSEPLPSSRPQPVAVSQPIEPEAVLPAPAPRNESVVLLPKPNGDIGGVVVHSEGSEPLLLNTAYAGARIGGPGQLQAVSYDAETAKEEFGEAIESLPSRPATFMLYFLEGKDELTPESEGEVARVFAEINSRPDPEIWIIGHTDAVGTMQYNDQLSLQRAERVRQELISRGLSASIVEVAGRGKREPLIPTSEDTPEPMNRRVEISVR
jgi:OOP family OmpA-OmpF porin